MRIIIPAMPRRGQGAMEYLVLLAIVLVICMVVISLLGFMPGMSFESRKSEAKLYWSSTMPFQIPAHQLNAGSNNLVLVISNTLPDPMRIYNITLKGMGMEGGLREGAYLSGGERKTLNITLSNAACADGSEYEYDVVITYFNDDKKVVGSQYGAKRLVGQCNPVGGRGQAAQSGGTPQAEPPPQQSDYCGGVNEPCCTPGGTCNTGNMCQSGVCRECGEFLHACCGNFCSGGNACVFGTCI